ncbi:hypothetical protein F4561_002608 [Lipingzhangella halophila]|uniref:Uncharacterized protein n=1 Tax=Lipingzhangella halophila TaxID=1783352 RepID=A0A7W7RGX9_9ACTN|nr:hypothetical protein [Lipingzhangella halophila]
MTGQHRTALPPCACGCPCGPDQRCHQCGACACMAHGDGCLQPPLGEPAPLPEPSGGEQ